MTHTFDDLWQTLTAHHLEGADPAVTITPQDYRADEPDGDPTLAPASLGTSRQVETLPFLALSSEPGVTDLEVRGVLGTGGMGVVHLAHQHSLSRDVAVKTLTRSDAESVRGLLDEAVITGALEHPNIVPVHALARGSDGMPVLVMKCAEGARWSSLLASDATPGLDRHLDILRAVCNALSYAHSRGVVHRDVKPENVRLGSFGEVYLLDWGIAAPVNTRSERVVGTPGFLAPEMISGAPIDPRTDVYLVGATLHNVLTGQPRHTGETLQDVLNRAWESREVHYGPEVPSVLGQICNRATHRDPTQRFASIAEFLAALDAYENHRTSVELADAAARNLHELYSATRAERDDVTHIRSLGSGMRFALRESLEAWPENPTARRTLRAVLELMVDWELRQDHPREAEALLDELETLSDQPRSYEGLREVVGQRVRRRDALSRLGRELDLSVAGFAREAFMIGAWILATVTGSAFVFCIRMGWVELDHLTSIGSVLVATLTYHAMLLMFRTHTMANVANRRVWFTALVTTWGILLHRIFGWWLGMEVEHVLSQDILILAVANGIAGVAISRGVLVITGILVVLAAASAVCPWMALELWTAALSVTFFLLAILFARWVRREPST